MKAWIILGITFFMIASSGCEGYKRPQSAHNATIAELEQTYGRIVTVSNVPTPDQNGTGDRMGLFRDRDGTFWGIPLSIGEDGGVFGCAPPDLREAPISGTLPASTVEIVGGANQPTPWRGGTGKLELLLRDVQGGLRWHAIEAIESKAEPVCWSQSEPPLPVKHYRLVIAEAGK